MSTLATVVIPTYHRAAMLAQCLRAVEIAVAAVPEGSVEVVVSDDGRDEQSRDLVKANFPRILYVKGPRRGPASNRNCGAAQATGKWLIFLDDDCLPDPGWLAGYFAGMLEFPDQPLFEGRTCADRPRRSYAEEAPVNDTGGYLWSCNMAISAELFAGVKGFCESFPSPALEDVDLRLRLSKAGHRAVFLTDACVCHPYRPMNGIESFRKHNASYRHLLQLHPELRNALSWKGIALNTLRMLVATVKAGVRYGCAGTGRVTYAALSKAWIDARCLMTSRASTTQ